jgi:hypothetical protein
MLKFTDVSQKDFEALLDVYKKNGGTLDEDNGLIRFSWGTLEELRYFGGEFSATAIVN